MNMRRLAAITITLTLSGFPGCYALELAGDADPGGDLFMADSDADAEAGADIDAEADENSEPCIPVTEECNGRDDDCDGAIDEDFGLGLPCDGPDADLCLDDVMTCDGCTTGPDMVETCDCADNDCDGAVDEGCEDRVCVVTLTVLGLDYPGHCWVDVPPVGSSDVVTYACTGSDVRFVFGDIVFTGLVTGCWIDVHARTTFPWSDGCDWETSQSIVGELLPGRLLDYTYREAPIPGQTGCVYSCDASGTIRVE